MRRLIQVGNLEALAEGDELLLARRSGTVFQGWEEGPLTFAPTYKFRCGRAMLALPDA